MEKKEESEVAQSCPTLCKPMDCSLPGFSIHGIFQARVLEWGATAFSEKMTRTDIIVIEREQILLSFEGGTAFLAHHRFYSQRL